MLKGILLHKQNSFLKCCPDKERQGGASFWRAASSHSRCLLGAGCQGEVQLALSKEWQELVLLCLHWKRLEGSFRATGQCLCTKSLEVLDPPCDPPITARRKRT